MNLLKINEVQSGKGTGVCTDSLESLSGVCTDSLEIMSCGSVAKTGSFILFTSPVERKDDTRASMQQQSN